MYGMVNKLLINALEIEYGGEIRSELEKRSGTEADFFISMEQYPDAITYDIVAAASQIIGVSAEQLLEMFGKRWVQMTSEGEYGHYYAMAEDVFDFLQNLNSLHQSLAAGLRELRPPSFELTKLDDSSVQLQYMSDRSGLTYFVVGLIRGLADYYGQEIALEITANRQSGAPADLFRISIV